MFNIKIMLMGSYEETPSIVANKTLVPKWANLKAFQNFSIEFLQGTIV